MEVKTAMIVAITGGTGFIGRHLVTCLVKRGVQVRVLTRRPEITQRLWPRDNAKLWVGNLTGPVASLVRFVNGADLLYHCAAEIHNKDRMHEVHIRGTRNLIKAASGNIGRWVQLSSVGVYGPHDTGMVTEQTPLNPVGVYEKTKTESDQLVINAARKGTFTCSILRPSNVYGPTMTNQSLFQLIEMISKGLFFFIGKPGASANYIHVDNVAEALFQCGKMPRARGQIYNLSDHLTMEEFVAIIADELGQPMPRRRLPEIPVRCIVKLLGRFPRFPLTESRVNALTNRSLYSTEWIQHQLGYVPKISMENGLHQMVKAWKQAS